MQTFFKKISNAGDQLDEDPIPPLNLSVIPNYMGINLCSVDYISWQRMDDGQLTNLMIHFLPDEKKIETLG